MLLVKFCVIIFYIWFQLRPWHQWSLSYLASRCFVRHCLRASDFYSHRFTFVEITLAYQPRFFLRDGNCNVYYRVISTAYGSCVTRSLYTVRNYPYNVTVKTTLTSAKVSWLPAHIEGCRYHHLIW